MKLNLWVIVALAILLLAGCGGSPITTPTDTPASTTSTPPSTTSTTPTTAISTSTAPPSSGPPTAGSMAEEGRDVYSVTCSPCHGPLGQGSSEAALIGPGSDLGQYGTAGALLDFISRAMPYGDPGSLTTSQYNQVTAFLVVEDGLVKPAVVWDNLADMGLSETQ